MVLDGCVAVALAHAAMREAMSLVLQAENLS